MLPSVGVSSDIDIHEADVLAGLYERVSVCNRRGSLMKSPRSSGTPSLVRYNPEHPLATDVAEAVSAQQERHIKLLAL